MRRKRIFSIRIVSTISGYVVSPRSKVVVIARSESRSIIERRILLVPSLARANCPPRVHACPQFRQDSRRMSLLTFYSSFYVSLEGLATNICLDAQRNQLSPPRCLRWSIDVFRSRRVIARSECRPRGDPRAGAVCARGKANKGICHTRP